MSNAKLAKSGKHPDLKMGTYNCNGLTHERLSWLIGSLDGTQVGLGFDFLALTECHGGEWLADVWGRKRLLVSGPSLVMRRRTRRLQEFTSRAASAGRELCAVIGTEDHGLNGIEQ